MQEFLAGVGVAAVAAGGWFGNFIGTFRPAHDGKAPSSMVASSTRAGTDKGAARQGTKADPACVKSAVVTREEALADAVRTFGDAVADAYDTRAAAVEAAYAKTGDETVRASLKAAWDAFKASNKSARDTWNGTQRAAWKAFESSVKGCGGTTPPVTDSMNASVDAMPVPAQ